MLMLAAVPLNYEISDDTYHQVLNYNDLAPGASLIPLNYEISDYHELEYDTQKYLCFEADVVAIATSVRYYLLSRGAYFEKMVIL